MERKVYNTMENKKKVALITGAGGYIGGECAVTLAKEGKTVAGKYLKAALQDAGVPKIEIERDSHRVRVFVHCAKPGMVIGRGYLYVQRDCNQRR